MDDTPRQPRSARRTQAIIWGLGLLVTAVMLTLGLWQMQVFRSQGREALEARMHQPAVAVESVADTSGIPRDAYGRPVTAAGTYLPGHDILVPDAEGAGCRVLSPLRLANGTVLPVVRGTSPTCTAPPLPSGPVTEVGVFLPSEGEARGDLGPGRLATVRLPLLAQQWDGALMPGFLSADAPHAAAYGLEAAPVALPSNAGQARNSGYALQWWLFAAAAVAATVKLSRDAATGRGFMAAPNSVDNPVEG